MILKRCGIILLFTTLLLLISACDDNNHANILFEIYSTSDSTHANITCNVIGSDQNIIMQGDLKDQLLPLQYLHEEINTSSSNKEYIINFCSTKVSYELSTVTMNIYVDDELSKTITYQARNTGTCLSHIITIEGREYD